MCVVVVYRERLDLPVVDMGNAARVGSGERKRVAENTHPLTAPSLPLPKFRPRATPIERQRYSYKLVHRKPQAAQLLRPKTAARLLPKDPLELDTALNEAMASDCCSARCARSFQQQHIIDARTANLELTVPELRMEVVRMLKALPRSGNHLRYYIKQREVCRIFFTRFHGFGLDMLAAARRDLMGVPHATGVPRERARPVKEYILAWLTRHFDEHCDPLVHNVCDMCLCVCHDCSHVLIFVAFRANRCGITTAMTAGVDCSLSALSQIGIGSLSNQLVIPCPVHRLWITL